MSTTRIADYRPTDSLTDRQQTLLSPIDCVGTGLHSGRRVTLTLRPAAVDSGLSFRRVDLPDAPAIPATFDRVVQTRLSTVLGSQVGEGSVGTVEHLIASLAGCGIDNAIIDVDGPEIPVFDGSAAEFVFLIDCAGRVGQDAARRRIEVLRPVRVDHPDAQAFAELHPQIAGRRTLDIAMSIDFSAPAIGRQARSLTLTEASFRAELADSRTFALAAEIESLRQAGLALGGSLDNAIVVDGERVLNPLGLRHPDEFVRHKLMDAVGDLALAGAPLIGRMIGHRSGHALNNRLLRALFSDRANWRWSRETPAGGWVPLPMTAAA